MTLQYEKKYRCVGISLLIGLLIFHILSSCVRTKQTFAHRDKVQSHQSFYLRATRRSENLKKFGPLVILVLWTVVVSPALIVASWYMRERPFVFNTTHLANNSFMPITAMPFVFGTTNGSTSKADLYDTNRIPTAEVDNYN
ncbi:hypothetical protein [Cardinium endosymbiont of Nabis limbatus]|uniref:hypothetical protein n=1 Tax=Cardinium endosymbiont of Nabis limbatus TaxID=3066217 RepID=UPI003AF404B5